MAKIKQALSFEVNLFQPGPTRLGIDIGSSGIKVAIVKETPQGFSLKGLYFQPVEKKEGADEKAQAAEGLKTLIERLKVKNKKALFVFNSPSLIVRNLLLPQMPDSELKESIRWAVEKDLTIPLEEAVIDYVPAGEVIKSGVRNLELTVAVANKSETTEILNLAAQSKVKLEAISLGCYSLWNAFQRSANWEPEEVIAFLDLGANATRLHIFNNGNLRFTREVMLGGNHLTEAIQKEQNLSWEEAEKLKVESGLEDNSPVRQVLTGVIHQIIEEIERSFSFFRTQARETKIDKLVIFGGGASLKNIEKSLSEGMALPVLRVDPLYGIKHDIPSISEAKENLPAFSAALGLVVTGGLTRRVNLSPSEAMKEVRVFSKENILKTGIVFLILLFIAGYWFLQNRVSGFKKQKTDMQSVVELWQNKQSLISKRDFVRGVISGGEILPDALKGISRVIPEGVWLTSLAIQEEGGMKTLKVSGEATNNTAVTTFSEELEKLPHFGKVELKYDRKGTQTVFEIRTQVK